MRERGRITLNSKQAIAAVITVPHLAVASALGYTFLFIIIQSSLLSA